MRFVQCEWEICTQFIRPPACNLFSGKAIYRRNLASVGHIDKNPLTPPLQLEALRMSLEHDVSDLSSTLGVDHGQGAVSITDIDAMSRVIDANIVGIVAKLDLSDGCEFLAPKKSH